MALVGALVGALAGGAGAGSIFGIPAGFTVGAGTTIAGGVVGAGVGAAAGEAGRKTMTGGIKLPEMPMEEVPPTTVKDVEGQEYGWADLLRRVTGRRATILTDPQLGQRQPFVRRATLLAG